MNLRRFPHPRSQNSPVNLRIPKSMFVFQLLGPSVHVNFHRSTCCIPSFSHYSESEHSRRIPLNLKNIDQHGGNLKFNLVQVSWFRLASHCSLATLALPKMGGQMIRPKRRSRKGSKAIELVEGWGWLRCFLDTFFCFVSLHLRHT